MLSKSQISFVKSLHQKKYRRENGLFLVEGIKSIKEFIQSSYQIHTIFYTTEQREVLPQLPANINLFEVNNAELAKISTLQTPQGFMALVYIPKNKSVSTESLANQFTLVLDGVQDPGNMGTIIRTADWFGFKQIICSEDTVEAYNPKTVQATMGSLARVNISYVNLLDFISESKIPVFGALLEGKSIYKIDWKKEGLIILGNEGKGITQEVISKVNQPVTIPNFGEAESLNVAVSAAIFCSEIRRTKN
ncbi:TrmH family RNA methyltransferase [Pedobacter rhizosphaerae]|uniref:RNA methyltransferase, TrmH family n=1 Tax=Pedobacter rhizosphaerae TaxID=390241 RepID=A0A1H9K063_9SPHI|nr:RNA methyltransferase [Pedobacter rhizosphaerae]SEQ92454.1 RNA methyltransferase, TrmH family [Pedobacter rhizosphaerae]